jgi:hypothetical protein
VPVRWNTAFAAGLLSVLLPIVATGCGGSSKWESRATFTIDAAAGSGAKTTGPFAAADSTVPAGPSGNAELQGSTGGKNPTATFQAIIGGSPDDTTTQYQFTLELPGFRGTGSYHLRSDESGTSFEVAVGSNPGDIWSLDRSHVATCAIAITADAATRDRTIRKITGSISCRGLEDGNTGTTTSALTGHFAVFTQIWCDPLAPVKPCVTPSPEA